MIFKNINIATKQFIKTRAKKKKALGVLLCYNDADILPEALDFLLENNHDLLVVDHGSSDETANVILKYKKSILKQLNIPRSFDFYDLYQNISQILLNEFINKYDWISWPDQDEILEGPKRNNSYWNYILEVLDSPFDYLIFNNYNYWFTENDNKNEYKVVNRVRRYCIFPDCAPRIRAWKASSTNIRVFNHNPTNGEMYPEKFNLKHYPMRSLEQMQKRLQLDRAGLKRNGSNYHYENMKSNENKLIIRPSLLHFDDGLSDLNPDPIFSWRSIYGYS